MKKQIIIVGAGISGLALLHYLKSKYANNNTVEIRLFEKSDTAGGNIHSIRHERFLFECGPNGFLNSKPQTLKLIDELKLNDSVIRADESSKIRCLSVNHKLYPLPDSPQAFIRFPLFTFYDKLRVLGEFFVPKNPTETESVYAFGQRRLGKKFAEYFLDPMVSGIYGGDARQLILKCAFPRIHELEKEFGSLFKALFQLKKKKGSPASMGLPKGTLTSFKNGMEEIIQALAKRYSNEIHFKKAIQIINFRKNQFILETSFERFYADELYLATPAFASAKMLLGLDKSLSNRLEKINYAPIAVVGLVYLKKDFKTLPKGFGYIIPSSEKREVLGVLWESNIFSNRADTDHILTRIMIGGVRHPEIIQKTKEGITALAIKELEPFLNPSAKPQLTFIKNYSKAIPQYDIVYTSAIMEIEECLKQLPNLHLVANYWKGVSFNDCIENAFQMANASKLI